MMKQVLLVIFCIIVGVFCVINLPQEYHSTYQFRFANSFRPPFFVIGQNQIPFFQFGGSAIATEEYIRLTPFSQSTIGYMWNREKSVMRDWEAFLEFQVHGSTHGADGMALWYTKRRSRPGPIFGNEDKWNGLAVILDSFDNDDNGNNPHISVIVNNGNNEYNKAKDGLGQEVAGCQYNFRNSRETLVMIVRYEHRMLSVSFGHKSEDISQFYRCVDDVYIGDLPGEAYFGVSAATGEVTDMHDIYSLNVYDLNPTYTAPLDEEPQTKQETHDDDEEVQPKKETHADEEPLTEEELQSLKEMLSKEDEKNFTEPVPMMKTHKNFDTIVEELDGIEKKKKASKHEKLDLHVEVPKEDYSGGSLSKDSFDHVFNLIHLLEEHQVKMAHAFDAILTSLDEEKETQSEQYATFAKSFRGIYENMIGKGDIKKLVKRSRELEHLKPKIDIITRVIADLKTDVDPTKSTAPHNSLNTFKSHVESAKHQKDSHSANLRSQVSNLESQLSSIHASLEESKPSGSILIYVMAVQTVLFFVYVIYFVFTTKKKKY